MFIIGSKLQCLIFIDVCLHAILCTHIRMYVPASLQGLQSPSLHLCNAGRITVQTSCSFAIVPEQKMWSMCERK